MPRTQLTADVAIIGAGPAGLAAAYLLTKAGCTVAVIEKDPVYVGGISRTAEYRGFRFDIGGHRFFSKSVAVVALWNELLPQDFLERRRLSRILYAGKFYSYPLKAMEALSNLGLYRSALCMVSFAKAKVFPIRDVRSFQDWTVNQFGHELFRIFFKSYAEKVWGIPCDQISADWAAQRIRGLNLWRALADGVARSLGVKRLLSGRPAPKTLIESFRYPRLGPGQMWEAARGRVEAAGNRVLMGHALDALSYDAATGDWLLRASSAGGGADIVARHVVSSAAISDLAAKLSPAPRSKPHADALKYRDFLTVALVLRSNDVFPDNWIYIHDPRVKVGRIQNFRSWSEDMVPDRERACVGLEYFCFEGDGMWTSSDEELIALAKAELALLGLCAPEQVLDGTVVRQQKAYPVYDDGYADRVAAIRADLETAYPTLHLVGRNGMHRYNNQDHSMLTAMLTVKNILAGRRVDTWSINEDAEYHEDGRQPGDGQAWGDRPVPQKLKDTRAAS